MKFSCIFICNFYIFYQYKCEAMIIQNKTDKMKPTKTNIKLIFGLKLKQLRQDKNLSLSELAVKSGLSVSYLNEIESGKKYPKADKIAVLSEALNVNYDKLVSLKTFETSCSNW